MGKASRGRTLRTQPDVEGGIRAPAREGRHVLVCLDTFRVDHMAILTASMSWRSPRIASRPPISVLNPVANRRRRLYTVFGMTRRREISNEKLSEAELVALRQRLSAMTLHDLESFYKATHNACRYTETRAPAPALVQEFVQAWKQLRRVKRKF